MNKFHYQCPFFAEILCGRGVQKSKSIFQWVKRILCRIQTICQRCPLQKRPIPQPVELSLGSRVQWEKEEAQRFSVQTKRHALCPFHCQWKALIKAFTSAFYCCCVLSLEKHENIENSNSTQKTTWMDFVQCCAQSLDIILRWSTQRSSRWGTKPEWVFFGLGTCSGVPGDYLGNTWWILATPLELREF